MLSTLGSTHAVAHFDRCSVTEETGIEKPFTPEVTGLLVQKKETQANTLQKDPGAVSVCVREQIADLARSWMRRAEVNRLHRGCLPQNAES